MFKKKKAHLKGFPAKPRTRKEVDQDYYHEAVMHGHKSRMVNNLLKDVEDLQKQIDEHLEKLCVLNLEGMKCPAEEVTEPVTPEVTPNVAV